MVRLRGQRQRRHRFGAATLTIPFRVDFMIMEIQILSLRAMLEHTVITDNSDYNYCNTSIPTTCRQIGQLWDHIKNRTPTYRNNNNPQGRAAIDEQVETITFYMTCIKSFSQKRALRDTDKVTSLNVATKDLQAFIKSM